jgi:hypothetical protein
MGLLSSLKTASVSPEEMLAAFRPQLRVGPARITSVGPARITDTGPDGAADWKDARYWVEWVAEPDPDDAKAPVDFLKLRAAPILDPPIVQATNLAELPTAGGTGGCHLLSPKRTVWVLLISGNGMDRYVFDVNPSPVQVRVTSDTGCGSGVYNGLALRLPTTTADLDKSVDLGTSDIGDGGPVCIILNAQEVNTTGQHWLTNAGNTDQKDFLGTLVRVNADGTPVIRINGVWGGPCATSPPPPP